MKDAIYQIDKLYYISLNENTSVEEMTEKFNYQTNTVDKLKRFLNASHLLQKRRDNFSLRSTDEWLRMDIFIFHTLLHMDKDSYIRLDKKNGRRPIGRLNLNELPCKDVIENMVRMITQHIRTMVPIGYKDETYESALRRRIEKRLGALKWREEYKILLTEWAFHMFDDLLLGKY